jgi:hypothetical protein
MEFLKRIGLYPRKLVAGAYNPEALKAAFARPSNALHAPMVSRDGSIRIGDRFGLGGYSVPLPDELRAKAGTIYPGGMQLYSISTSGLVR